MKHKLSQWHSADTKPVHVGVYEVKTKEMGRDIAWSHWNGKRWSMQTISLKFVRIWVRSEATFQNKQWRGIVK